MFSNGPVAAVLNAAWCTAIGEQFTTSYFQISLTIYLHNIFVEKQF